MEAGARDTSYSQIVVVSQSNRSRIAIVITALDVILVGMQRSLFDVACTLIIYELIEDRETYTCMNVILYEYRSNLTCIVILTVLKGAWMTGDQMTVVKLFLCVYKYIMPY